MYTEILATRLLSERLWKELECLVEGVQGGGLLLVGPLNPRCQPDITSPCLTMKHFYI